jgi:hypothetical protein
MKASIQWLRRQMAGGLIVLLLAPMAQAMPQQDARGEQSSQAENATAETQEQLPDAPGAYGNLVASAAPQQANAPKPGNQQSQAQRPANQTEPVGTAAAPYEQPVGAAASRPAGAVIAPAKQKRKRTFLIRMGLGLGAAVAIGTVAALSKASPARPSR